MNKSTVSEVSETVTDPAFNIKLELLCNTVPVSVPAWSNTKPPASTVRSPVLVLVPVKVKVPDPSLVKLPSCEITPEKVVSVLSPPTVRVVPDAISILPAPAIDPIVSVVSLS